MGIDEPGMSWQMTSFSFKALNPSGQRLLMLNEPQNKSRWLAFWSALMAWMPKMMVAMF